jgi:hypothetical protein
MQSINRFHFCGRRKNAALACGKEKLTTEGQDREWLNEMSVMLSLSGSEAFVKPGQRGFRAIESK